MLIRATGYRLKREMEMEISGRIAVRGKGGR
jgi:hypothetical protein